MLTNAILLVLVVDADIEDIVDLVELVVDIAFGDADGSLVDVIIVDFNKWGVDVESGTLYVEA